METKRWVEVYVMSDYIAEVTEMVFILYILDT